MAHVNNIFAATVAFITIAGFEYLIYPTSSTFVNNLPSDIGVFAAMAHLGIFVLCLLGIPFLLAIQTEHSIAG